MVYFRPESKRWALRRRRRDDPGLDRDEPPSPDPAAPMCHAGRVLHLRQAGIGDLAAILPRTLALNAHEGIAVDPPALEAALDRLLRDPALGGIW